MFDQPKYLNTWESETGLDGNDFERNLITVRLTGYSFSRTKVVVKFKMSSKITMFQIAQQRVSAFDKLDNLIRQIYSKSIRMAIKLKRLQYGVQPVRFARRVNRRSGVFHKKRSARDLFVSLYYSRHHVRTVRIDRRRKQTYVL